MIRVRFKLRSPDKVETAVTGYITCNSKRCSFSTGVRVKVSKWNEKTQRVTTKGPGDSDHIKNTKLDEIVSDLTKLYHHHRMGGIRGIDPKFIRDQYINPVKNVTPLDWIESYISESGSRMNNATGKTISYRTIQKMSTVFNRLKSYSNDHPFDSWDSLDIPWRDRYVSYLHSLNLSANTVSKEIDTIKQFIIAAHNNGQHTCTHHRRPGFTAPRETIRHIYLTVDEIKRIEEVDLSEYVYLETSRDRFVIECWTGLRYSDITKLPELITGSDIIEVITEKTGERVHIPLMDPVKRVLAKYEGKQLPGFVVNQVYNRHLKEVAKLAGIDSIISRSKIIGGQVKREKHLKWQKVTSHTSRRSFATNLYLLGVPAQSIMLITGHRTEQQFMKYICVESEVNANLILKQLRGKL